MLKRQIQIFCILCALPVLPAVLTLLLHPQALAWNTQILAEGEVSLAIVQAWNKPVLWVDARSPEKYARKHMEGAVNLYAEEFDQQIGAFLDQWSPGHRVVVYCDSGACGASKEIARRLQEELQIEEVYVLKEERMDFIRDE
jgi:rhodanese-related sulfurtransferase